MKDSQLCPKMRPQASTKAVVNVLYQFFSNGYLHEMTAHGNLSTTDHNLLFIIATTGWSHMCIAGKIPNYALSSIVFC